MIRVAVVSDVTLYREGMARLLADEQALDVVGTAGGCDEAVALLGVGRADVVLVDMAMPSSEATIRALRRTGTLANVIALGVADVEEEVLACIEAGAAGYVARDAPLGELTALIRSVNGGEVIVTPRMAAALARRLSSLAAHRPIVRPGTLSLREVEIARLVATGLPNKEIAARLCIAPTTVKNHVHNILEKLGIERRSEIAAHLVRRPVERLSAEHAVVGRPADGTTCQ